MHGLVILEGQEINIGDVANAPNKDSAGAKNFLASGYSAVTMMPMLREGEAIGVISVVRVSPGPLSAEQLSILRAFAAQAVIAIENTRMVNELRQTNTILGKVSHQLAKYIPPQLYQSILSGEQDVTIASKRKKLTIFFSDIVSFTEITDQLESEVLTALLNEYLTAMSEIAEDYGANFNKFIGDAIMCYFGDPESKGVKEDADTCVRMALAMRRRIGELEADWRGQGLIDRPFEARMGINTGYCTVGNFGSLDRMDYTIIGREVNLAARLEAHADTGGILMAAETYSLVKDWLLAEEQDAISMKGFAQPVRTFRVRGTLEELAKQEDYFHHEDDGLIVSIQGDRADKRKAIEALERALALLGR
jgi:class 3 adenylate cyclase